MDSKQIKTDAESKMKSSVEDARRKFASIRTGRASVHLLDNIVVDYYGTPTPLNQIAAISAPEPQLLTIQPWDQTSINAIEKAIRVSDLGINPSNDGKVVRLPIPPLTEERRKQMVRSLHESAEEHRTAIRNIRRDGNDKAKQLLKDKTISEDEERQTLAEIQKLTDSYVEKVNELMKKKEEELMKV
jgi:ribosome recycling factor